MCIVYTKKNKIQCHLKKTKSESHDIPPLNKHSEHTLRANFDETDYKLLREISCNNNNKKKKKQKLTASLREVYKNR